jgi:hypothetical protein
MASMAPMAKGMRHPQECNCASVRKTRCNNISTPKGKQLPHYKGDVLKAGVKSPVFFGSHFAEVSGAGAILAAKSYQILWPI